jgi:hypothetical protein
VAYPPLWMMHALKALVGSRCHSSLRDPGNQFG